MVGMNVDSFISDPHKLTEDYPDLIVPKFQRSYCWELKRETAQLIDDLLSDIRFDDSNNTPAASNYYIGQILL